MDIKTTVSRHLDLTRYCRLFCLPLALLALRMGTTGFAAQAAGREDGTALRQILLQGLLLSVLLSMLLGAIAVPFSSLALSVMQPSAELHALALDFFHIRLLGLPAALASYARPARRPT